MDLILWRHAEAEPQGAAADDLARRLTSKGERQAERMAAWLNRRLPQTTRIVVSPARRAQQTARALDRGFKTLGSIAPGASVEDVLAAARWPDAAEPVLVVGHQPTLGAVAARLVAGLDTGWPMKKAAVWWLRLRERANEEGMLVQAVQSPDFLD